jgi:hypothetical protein
MNPDVSLASVSFGQRWRNCIAATILAPRDWSALEAPAFPILNGTNRRQSTSWRMDARRTLAATDGIGDGMQKKPRFANATPMIQP